MFPVVLRLRSGFGVAVVPPRLLAKFKLIPGASGLGNQTIKNGPGWPEVIVLSLRACRPLLKSENKLTSDNNKQSVATLDPLKFSFF